MMGTTILIVEGHQSIKAKRVLEADVIIMHTQEPRLMNSELVDVYEVIKPNQGVYAVTR